MVYKTNRQHVENFKLEVNFSQKAMSHLNKKNLICRFSNNEAQILGERTTTTCDMGEQMLGEMEDIEVKGELPQLLLLLYIPIILVS